MSAPLVRREGPLTAEELFEVWRSAVDSLYSQPLVDKGDGSGIEVYKQLFEQLVRVSVAVDVTTQAMFILPFSGQTAAPASGERKAQVTLSISRSKRLDLPMVIDGRTFFFEQLVDWGENPGEDGVLVATGRRYRLLQPLTFLPGEMGPKEAVAEAERPGWGYNNPFPGNIDGVEQPGSNFANDAASVEASPSGPSLVRADIEADTFVPEHAGQYFIATAGSNVGKVARITGYVAPTPIDGGSVTAERIVAFDGVATGTFEVGERISQAGSGASGAVLGGNAVQLVASVSTGTPTAGGVWTGVQSGATFAPTTITSNSTLSSESTTLAWRIFSWANDWGLAVTNEASPAGGCLGFLDELGRERNLPRSGGEGDDAYRNRIARIADVVSPNAVMRAVSGVATPLGLSGCLREVGTTKLPGFFFDKDFFDQGEYAFVPPPPIATFAPGEIVRQTNPTTGAVATGRATVRYATPGFLLTQIDGVVPDPGSVPFVDSLPIVGVRTGSTYTPPVGHVVGGPLLADRYRYVLSYLEMRAFFLVSLPRTNLGEFGLFLDEGFLDAAPYSYFYDGFPVGQATFYAAVWNAVEKVRAGGVAWDIVTDVGPCS